MAGARKGATRAHATFVTVAGALVFGMLVAGLLALGSGAASDLDAALRRTRGERVGQPVTGAQADYAFEVRQGGTVAPLSLAALGGRLVFLNFWGTFCPPCVEELPSLLALARSRPDDLLVLAVSYDDSWAAIDAFFRRFTSESVPPNFVVVRDPARTPGRDLKALFGTEKLPESYLLRNGVVAAKFVSARDWTDPDVGRVLDAL
jgi:thiol-disulfide isomerase/thioredoxin